MLLFKHMVVAYATGPLKHARAAPSTPHYEYLMKNLDSLDATALGEVQPTSNKRTTTTVHGKAHQA